MRFLVDENIGNSIVAYLRSEGHDTVWIKEMGIGMDDLDILKLALKEKRVLVTYDQDFGELVFRRKEKHRGVLLLRLSIDIVSYHLRALKNFLEVHRPSEIRGRFWKIGDEYL